MMRNDVHYRPAIFGAASRSKEFGASVKENFMKKAPVKEEKFLKSVQERFRLERMISNSGLDLNSQMKKKVIQNVYRQRYDIPMDLMVRRADADIIASVKNSESLA